MANPKQTPFRTMGIDISKASSIQEALELTRLNYEVGITPLYGFPNDIKQKVNHSATFRTDTSEILGVVGNRYTVVQNSEMFDLIKTITDNEQGLEWVTGGYYNNGGKVFVSVKLPKTIRLKDNPNDVIENYLLFSSSHDGSGSITVALTPLRVVCQNILNAAIQNASTKWVFKHTKNVNTKIKTIHSYFEIVNDEIDSLSSMFSMMNEYNLTEQQIKNVIFKTVLSKDEYTIENNNVIQTSEISTRKTNLIYQIEKSIYRGVGQDILNPETAYGVFNGITNYVQNVKKYSSDEDQFKNVYTKSNISNKVFKELMDIVNG
jgi:phage/plasmid-like protein (TIGR03299 family)